LLGHEEKTEYILKIEKGLVIKEKLIIGSKSNEPLLDRDESGKGKISLLKNLIKKFGFKLTQQNSQLLSVEILFSIHF
jgi:midasin (ATPase involved in ribosome maturation)